MPKKKLKIKVGGILQICLAISLLCSFGTAQKGKKILSAEDYYKFGTAKMQKNDYKIAVKDFSKAIELYPFEAKYYLKRGGCFDKLAMPEKAVKDYSRAIELNPDLTEAYIRRAEIFANFELEKEKAESLDGDALADFNKAVGTDPKNADAFLARGTYFLRKIDYKNALADYNQAVRIQPGFAKAYIKRAEFYLMIEDYSKALADSMQAIKSNPKNAEGYETRALVYSQTGEYEKAIGDYTRALKFDPDNPSLLFNRALSYYQAGEIAKAEADERRALRLNKTAPREKRVYTIAVEERPLSPKQLLTDEQILDSYYELSKKDAELLPADRDDKGNKEIVEHQNMILQLNPKSVSALFERGRAFFRLREYGKAIVDFTEIIKLDPNDFYAFNNRGIACAKSGNYERAIADFARVLSINPEQYSAGYNFALVLFSKGLPDQAVRVVSSYIEKVPDDMQAFQLRAKAYRKLGKIAEAEADERKAEMLR